MLIIGISGYVFFKGDGMPGRFTPEEQILLKIDRLNWRTNPEGYNGRCHTDSAEYSFFDFEKHCPVTNNSKPLMLVWGDSHAAHLIPGLKKFFGNTFNILQRSAAASTMKKRNKQIFDEIIKLNPYIIILSNMGTRYKNEWEEIIPLLKNKGLSNIFIVGYTPYWKKRVPTELIVKYRKTKRFPVRLNELTELRFKYSEEDQMVEELSKRFNVGYVSTRKHLCNKDGCLTRANDDLNSVLYFDDHHFTAQGSEFVVGKIKDDIQKYIDSIEDKK